MGCDAAKAALEAYWWFLQGALYRGLATISKLAGPEALIRVAIAEFRKAIADRLFSAMRGVAYSGEPRDLADYLATAAKAHDAIASLGVHISLITVERSRGCIHVEVRNAVPGMEVVPVEDRHHAMLVSIGVLMGIVEAVTGRVAGLEVPQMGLYIPPVDGPLIRVSELDIEGNRYRAVIVEKDCGY